MASDPLQTHFLATFVPFHVLCVRISPRLPYRPHYSLVTNYIKAALTASRVWKSSCLFLKKSNAPFPFFPGLQWLCWITRGCFRLALSEICYKGLRVSLHESHNVLCFEKFVGPACSSVLLLFQALHNSNMLPGHSERLRANSWNAAPSVTHT